MLRGSVGIVSTIQRAMLFVSTKAGYVDAELLAAAGKAAAPPDVADGPHCIAPACLQASLERSLRLLRLATVRRRGSRACCEGVPRGMQRRRCPVTHRWISCTCTMWPRRSWRAWARMPSTRRSAARSCGLRRRGSGARSKRAPQHGHVDCMCAQHGLSARGSLNTCAALCSRTCRRGVRLPWLRAAGGRLKQRPREEGAEMADRMCVRA